MTGAVRAHTPITVRPADRRAPTGAFSAEFMPPHQRKGWCPCENMSVTPYADGTSRSSAPTGSRPRCDMILNPTDVQLNEMRRRNPPYGRRGFVGRCDALSGASADMVQPPRDHVLLNTGSEGGYEGHGSGRAGSPDSGHRW